MVKKKVIIFGILIFIAFLISNKKIIADSCPGDYCSNSGICGYACSDPYWSTSLNRCVENLRCCEDNGEPCPYATCWDYRYLADYRCPNREDGGGDDNGGTVTTTVIRCRCADWDPTPGCTEIGTCSGPANTGDCNGNDPIKYSCTVESAPDPECGNNIMESGEECDDGNTDNGDGCSSSCHIENGWYCPGATTCYTQCGDSIIVGLEQCDDGNANNGDGCDQNCQTENGWYCSGSPSSCNTQCTDGITAGFEECDDGNSNNGDGCNQNCQTENGWYCSGNPSICDTQCGDGITVGSEQCDDQNTNNNDCCDNSCNNVPPPPASNTIGVCQVAVKVCDDGNWVEPNYFQIPDYQETETMCDRKDNDCDGEWDEGLGYPYYYDFDEDKFGDKFLQPELLCPTDDFSLYVDNNLDCDDNNDSINPDAKEICGDNIDDDCSGTPDDTCPCSQGDIFCNNRPGVCRSYEKICGLDGKIPVCDWSSIENYEQNEITCDLLDNDCDNQIDEGCDDDKDSYVDSSMNCNNNFVDGNTNLKSCSDYDNDCDDNNVNVNPGNSEICDGLDNDCDNKIDNLPEDDIKFCHEIIPGYNNVGVCQNQKTSCNYQRYRGWYCPLNEFLSEEICNDNLDNDCDGLTDEGCACESGKERICGSDFGECRQGIQKCVNSQWGECEDSVNPVEETCDNLDNDCDGLIDDSVTKECSSNEGCPGIQTCHEGQWLECQAKCDNYIQIELNNDDFGKFVIDAKLNREDVKDSLETLKVINQTLSFSSKGDRISLKNTIDPTNELKDFEYNLYIPKCLTPYLDQIEFENKDYTIIKEDPLIAWHFVNVNDRIDLNYEVKGEIDEACLEQIKGLPIAKVIGAELDKSNAAQVRNNLIKFVIGIWIIFFAVGSVIYVSKRNPSKIRKSEVEYEKDFIDKERKMLLKKIKDMKFKSKEQARHHMENLGISDEIKEWILKKL